MNKPSKKTEWEKVLEKLMKDLLEDKFYSESEIDWLRRVKITKDIISLVKSLLHQRDNEIREKIQGMKKKETIIESCDNCGNDGYGKAWYGHGRATGDAWGDRYEPTGSMVFCKDCAKDFQIGDEWDGQEIWKRTSDREEHSTIRINSITHPDSKAIGYNACLDDLLTYLSNNNK